MWSSPNLSGSRCSKGGIFGSLPGRAVKCAPRKSLQWLSREPVHLSSDSRRTDGYDDAAWFQDRRFGKSIIIFIFTKIVCMPIAAKDVDVNVSVYL